MRYLSFTLSSPVATNRSLDTKIWFLNAGYRAMLRCPWPQCRHAILGAASRSICPRFALNVRKAYLSWKIDSNVTGDLIPPTLIARWRCKNLRPPNHRTHLLSQQWLANAQSEQARPAAKRTAQEGHVDTSWCSSKVSNVTVS